MRNFSDGIVEKIRGKEIFIASLITNIGIACLFLWRSASKQLKSWGCLVLFWLVMVLKSYD